MLSDKPWQFDAVLMLGLGMFISISVAVLCGPILLWFFPISNAADRQFLGFLFGSVGFQGVGLILVHRFLREHGMAWRNFLGLGAARLGRSLGFALVTGVAVLPLALGLNTLSKWLITSLQVEAVEQPSMRILEVSVSPGRRILFALAAIVAAPVIEEILFRGILYPFIKQLGWPRVALWGSAFLFAAIHANLMTFVPLTFLALVLTWVYEKTDALIAPILTHSFFNAVNFFVFIYREELGNWWNQMIDWCKHLRVAA